MKGAPLPSNAALIVEQYVIMQNHIHMTIDVDENKRRHIAAPTISVIVGNMKPISLPVHSGLWQYLCRRTQYE